MTPPWQARRPGPLGEHNRDVAEQEPGREIAPVRRAGVPHRAPREPEIARRLRLVREPRSLEPCLFFLASRVASCSSLRSAWPPPATWGAATPTPETSSRLRANRTAGVTPGGAAQAPPDRPPRALVPAGPA